MRSLLPVLLVLGVALPAQQADDAPPKIPTLLIGGANNHDGAWTHRSLADILEETSRFAVTITEAPAETLADAEELAKYRVLVLDYNGPRWGEPAESNFLAAVRGGAGVVVIHAANNAFDGWAEYEEMVALLWRKGTGHGRFHPFDVTVVDRDHPVTRGMADLAMHPDELYHRLVNTRGTDYRLLMHAMSSAESGGTGEHEPMVLVKTFGKGRVFHTPLGHVWKNVPASRASHRDPQFRRLVARGTEWAATGACTLDPTPINWVSPEERELGFERLFDGHSTDGWIGYGKDAFPDRGWKVEHGALVHAARGGGGDLVTAETFGDFELRFEWAITDKGNSGVIYRVGDGQPATYHTGPEFQVLDDHGVGIAADAPTSTGALYGLAAPAGKQLAPPGHALYDLAAPAGKQLAAPGDWNRGRIVVRGWQVEHWVNGVKVVDIDLDAPATREKIAQTKFAAWPFATLERGRIALQDHGNEVRYRSLRIRRLDAKSAGGAGR